MSKISTEHYIRKAWTIWPADSAVTELVNVCIWPDGTMHPARGHGGNCKWVYDGQVFYHKRLTK